jgi:hypothetical protein
LTIRRGRKAPAASAAEAKKGEYEARCFETQMIEEEGQFLVYTRRVVKEVVVEGEPPPA